MNVQVIEEPATELVEYASVPIAFTVDRVFDVHEDQLGRFVLTERNLDSPYIKDYDAIEGPAAWAERFSLSKWAFFVALVDRKRVGRAALALDTPGLTMLEGRTDLAVLWDIRVSPDVRGHGIGSALVRAAERCAVDKGCRELKVETQNTNVPACRFYARQGFALRTVDRNAYPTLKHEIQMLWHKPLSRSESWMTRQ